MDRENLRPKESQGRILQPRKRSRSRQVLLALLGVGAVVILLSPFVGTVAIPPGTVLRILAHQISGGTLGPSPCAGAVGSARLCQAYIQIVWDERLPEIMLALVAGAALGISGGTLQGVFRNPLADPFLLGISSGGAFGAALVFVYHIGETQANLVLPLAAFGGAMATGLAILAAARGRYSSVETLLLTGVALSSFLSAALSVTLLFSPLGSLQVDFWLLGGLGGATWNRDGISFGIILATSSVIAIHGRELNVMQLGSEVAQSVGVDIPRVRLRLILLASLATATAVAFTGIIGFVGLVSPHVIRRAAGTDYRIVLAGGALVGGAFLLAARDVSLLAFPTAELPIGIFTSFAGAPFFLYLLYRRRQTITMGGT